MAAQLSAADSNPSKDFGFISHTDLPKFDPGLKHSRQILYQFSEVNPSVCCKVKQDFIIIKCILYIDKLHFQSMFPYFFLTDLVSFLDRKSTRLNSSHVSISYAVF